MDEQAPVNPDIYPSFEPVTSTWQYVVADPSSKNAVIIDSVLDFDPAFNRIKTESADKLLKIVSSYGLTVTRILETHAHADHLTASSYLASTLSASQPRPKICIGHRITTVQGTFASKYSIPASELSNAFDQLLQDDEEFPIGNLKVKVLYLPGHTPDHVGYVIGPNVFTGDSIFNPDVGSARADFPGGSATDLYSSMQTLLSLPDEYRLYVGHDYPPDARPVAGETGEKIMAYTTVKEQREANKHVKLGTSEEDFVKFRSERDRVLGEPKLLHQALQVNVRAGRLPGDRVLRLPVKGEEGVLGVM